MYNLCMKKVYILILLTLILTARPLSEERVMELFEEIRQSEYLQVTAKWDNEIQTKSSSHSSHRKSIWDNSLDSMFEHNKNSTDADAEYIVEDVEEYIVEDAIGHP